MLYTLPCQGGTTLHLSNITKIPEKLSSLDFSKYQTLIDNIETAKYVVQCDINKYRNLPQYVIDGYRSVQCEIDKYRNAIITKIESCQDCINRIKGQKASNKEFYGRFIKELENVEF